MENLDLVELINKVQDKHGDDSFEITNVTIFDALPHDKLIKIIYDEGDLTKNFVKFSTDLLSGKFGQYFMEDIIRAYGEVLKTNKDDFKESYKNKPSSIKEILPSIFIHTSMSKVLMEILIVEVVTQARLSVKFFDIEKWKSEKPILTSARKCKSMTEFSKNYPQEYSGAVRLGMLKQINEEMKSKKNTKRLFV